MGCVSFRLAAVHVPLLILVAIALLLGGSGVVEIPDEIGGDAGDRAANADGAKPRFAGKPFAGTGYGFTIAKGWSDRTEDAASVEDLGAEEPGVDEIDVDAVIAGPGEKGEFRPNLTVVRTSEGIPEGVSAERLASANLATARRLGDVAPDAESGQITVGDTEVETMKLGGEPAAYYEQTVDSPAGQIRQRQIYAIQDGTAYALTFGSLPGGQWTASVPKLELMLKSWAWE